METNISTEYRHLVDKDAYIQFRYVGKKYLDINCWIKHLDA
jgi:hypothetical protein